MDHILNFALQGGNNNEDRQPIQPPVMPSPGQQWMQTNPQFCMPQGMVPMFAPTSQPFVQQPYFGPTCQPFVEQPTEGHANVPQSSARKQVKVKLGNFNAEEDVNIIKWWLGISTDPIINTGQRAARLEKEKNDRQLEIEERRLALDARRLEKEERVEEAQIVAEEERILNIDLDTCKPSMRFFYKAQQDKILAKYALPNS